MSSRTSARIVFEWHAVGGRRFDAHTPFGRGDIQVSEWSGLWGWSGCGCQRSSKRYQTADDAKRAAEKWLIRKCREVVKAADA